MSDDPPTYRIGPLTEVHNRAGFTCGKKAQDDYIRQYARKHHEHGVSRVFVANGDDEAEILGYYATVNAQVATGDLPPGLQKGLPRGRVLGAVLIGQLAVSVGHQGKGLGEVLLMDALRGAYENSKRAGMVAVMVDLEDESVRGFYAKYGFVGELPTSRRLFKAVRTIPEMIAEANKDEPDSGPG